jgi:hypothetical protein
MATIVVDRNVPRSGPKRQQADEEEISKAGTAKDETVIAQAADRLYKSAVEQRKKQQELETTCVPAVCFCFVLLSSVSTSV